MVDLNFGRGLGLAYGGFRGRTAGHAGLDDPAPAARPARKCS